MNKNIIFFLGGIALLAGTAIAIPAIIITAHLETGIYSSRGYCPITVDFSGYIEVNRACVVRYNFVRSDGKSSLARNLTFSSAGRQRVSYSWKVDSPCSGWVAIEAASIAPSIRARSNNANFTVNCILPPQISRVTISSDYRSDYVYDYIEVQGAHLHEPPGKLRKVLCDGNVVKRSDQMGGGFPDDFIPFPMLHSSIIFWDHVYQFAIEEDGAVISNVFRVKFPILVESVVPASARPGDEIQIKGGGFGSSAGSKVLKLGPYILSTIVSWSEHIITARVPSVPPGSYEIYIQRGGEIISGSVRGKPVLTVL